MCLRNEFLSVMVAQNIRQRCTSRHMLLFLKCLARISDQCSDELFISLIKALVICLIFYFERIRD